MTRTPILFALWLCSSPAFGADAPGPDLCALARSLDQIVAHETGYPPLVDCPHIGFGALPDTGGQRSQAGAYDPATGHIELAPDLDLQTALGRSFLLHELVHAAQYRAGVPARARCLAELEYEAYQVQGAYLAAWGQGEQAALIRYFSFALGQCPGDDPGY